MSLVEKRRAFQVNGAEQPRTYWGRVTKPGWQGPGYHVVPPHLKTTNLPLGESWKETSRKQIDVYWLAQECCY